MKDFNIHDFLMETVLGLVGKRPDFTVREMSMGWYSKGVFTVDDIETVEAKIQEQYPRDPVVETDEQTTEDDVPTDETIA